MSDSMLSETIAHAAELISQADALVIAVGAGMCVDSGLPDFRGDDGFWKAYPALARAGIEFSQIATPRSFIERPETAWGFYGHRLTRYRDASPHRGFDLLRQWGERMEKGYWVFTSNVDGHFQKSGFDPLRINECHGSIHYMQCLQPCKETVWPADEFLPEIDDGRCELLNEIPRCPRCRSIARPNILMFEDWQWVGSRRQLQEARQATWLAQATNPVVIELGAGTEVPTVRYFSSRIVRQHQGSLIRINPREDVVPDGYGVGIKLGALDALTRISALF